MSSGFISYFHPDHLGSTSVLTNGSGVKEQDPVYYPYGETYTNTGTVNVTYKYTGKELEDSTGLYFYEARYYDAHPRPVYFSRYNCAQSDRSASVQSV